MSVGQSLAEARAQRGLSVEDVSAATRIRAGLIRDIEADKFDACGGDVYARGHIRSIARTLGIDAAPLIGEFDSAHEPAEPPVVAAATVSPETDRHALAHSDKRRPNWAAAMIVALLVVIAVAAYGAFSGGGSKKPHSTVAGNSQNSVATNSQPATQRSKPATKPGGSSGSKTASIPANKAVLKIRATNAETWLQVSNAATGAVLYQGNLLPGQNKRFIKGFTLSFVIGNAPATDVVVGSKDIGSPPSSGNVARGKVRPGSSQIQQA